MANNQFQFVPVDYSKPYDEQPECKRHVIGAYANLARHNMTVTVNAIMQAIGMPLFNENEIAEAFNKSHRKKLAQLDNIQKVNLQKRLYRHFPFFKRMKLEDETKKSVQLNTLLEVMADFTSCMAMIRNFYTHYHPYNFPAELANQLKLKTEMGKRLQYLFENTSQMFKSNEALDHESNEVFAALRIPEDYVEEFMPGDKDYQVLYNLLNNPKVSRFQKQGIRLDMKSQKITKKMVRYIHNPEYQAYMKDDQSGMSDIAVIYFLCLFLEKKVAFELMEEVGLTEQIKFEGEHADMQMLYLKEIMCMNRIRMTKTKLDSEMTDTALALDMINELRKCPKPLYEVLSKEARDEFKDDSTVQWEKEHGKEAVDTEENSEEEELTSEKDTPRSTFVRWEDRFPQMALRYIDYQGLFKDIRFQLNLGKYRFAFYKHDKNYSIDNEERLRILQKEMHGFGRIQEVEVKKGEKWSGLFNETFIEEGLTMKKSDEVGQAPYVTEQRIQYAIDEKSHSIGLRWEGWQATGDKQKHYGDLDNQKMFIPYLPKKTKSEEKQTNQSEPLLPPQAMLSLYELPGLLFYQYLLTKQGKDKFEAENVIKNYYDGLRKFFEDVSNEVLKPVAGKDENESIENLSKLLRDKPYRLRLKDIPEKIKIYLLGRDVDCDEKLEASAFNRLKERKNRIEKELKVYREKIKKIGTKDNKFDKMRATLKTGQLAQWLVRDIMDWLPNNSLARKRLTGQTYMALQSSLAMLGQAISADHKYIDLNALEKILSNCLLIDKDGQVCDKKNHHPFLADVIAKMEESSIESFYEQYMVCEIEHINKVEDIIRQGEAFEDYFYIPFLHCERKRWEEPNPSSYKKLASRYIACPIQLPNGMFTTPIFNLLQDIVNANLHNALEKAKTNSENETLANNVAYLMRLYFEFVEHDHSQPFYDTEAIDGEPSPYRHVYRIFKKYFGEHISGTNQTTSPAYSIEKMREILKDKNKLELLILDYILDEVDKFKEKKERKLKKFNLKDYIDLQWAIVKKENASGKVCRNFQQRKEEVDRRVKEKKEEIEKLKIEVDKEIREYKDCLIRNEKRRFKKVENNERTIRRFKTQDMLLLIMAREILKAKSQDEDFTKGFSLKYVMTDSLLDKPIDFRWNVMVKGMDGKPTPKTIEQKGMKMKNYGQFYKFASDHQRLESLLSRLPEKIFLRAEIENEFSYYDSNRSEVFRQVYIIESEAYKLKPELQDDSNAESEWFFYIDKKTGKPRPIRNSFLQLLEILAAGEDGVLDDEEKATLQRTRNAFGHNTYDVDFDMVFKGKENKKKIPEVANGMKDKIEEQAANLKKDLDK